MLAAAVAFLAAAGALRAETVPLKAVSHIHGIAVDPADPQRLYLATHHGLYRTKPGGAAERVSNHRDDLMGFTPHPSDPGTFYASGHPERGGNLGFIVSTDGGVSWRQIAAGVKGPVDFHQMDISRSDPNVIYGAYGGLQRSADGGKSWRMVGPAPQGLIDLAVAPENADALYAATQTGLLISRDAGRSWAPAMILKRPTSMVESAADGNVYAYVVGTGLMRRDGANWTTLGALPGERFILYFAAAKDRFYAVTQRGEILESRDSGRSWQPYGG
ncbi:MAG TPA: exo-alpha-sialidase [Alphaproteobacteria bacterium]|nr:exo-alpha-sialidase [Alphaproteobacteria bacterium]